MSFLGPLNGVKNTVYVNDVFCNAFLDIFLLHVPTKVWNVIKPHTGYAALTAALWCEQNTL